MKFVEPYVELLNFKDIYERIEYATRNCYKSHEKSDPSNVHNFIMDKLDKKHFSVLEHSNIPVKWAFSKEEREDAFFIYQWLQAIKGESDAKIYITMPNEMGVIIISGNVRGWMDLFDYDIRSSELFNEGFLDMLETALSKEHPLFFINKNIIPIGEIGVISEREAYSYNPIHMTFTFEILTNRAVSHQLVRHRALSFSQESQRYCNYSLNKFDKEIKYCLDESEKNMDDISLGILISSLKASEDIYIELLKSKVRPEIARGVLPNATATTIIVTGRVFDIWDFIEKRVVAGAQEPIKKIAMAMDEIIGIKTMEMLNE